ncbi:hypothetical protein [Streptomyces sp. NPDC050988]|uniref:hypothetical protein n=1 Tax=Streptomyces sp. NPDC050988 TaxID=3365637 RepID=UPI0037BC4740
MGRIDGSGAPDAAAMAAPERERDRLTEWVDVLTRNRDAIGDYLAELPKRAA